MWPMRGGDSLKRGESEALVGTQVLGRELGARYTCSRCNAAIFCSKSHRSRHKSAEGLCEELRAHKSSLFILTERRQTNERERRLWGGQVGALESRRKAAFTVCALYIAFGVYNEGSRCFVFNSCRF